MNGCNINILKPRQKEFGVLHFFELRLLFEFGIRIADDVQNHPAYRQRRQFVLA